MYGANQLAKACPIPTATKATAVINIRSFKLNFRAFSVWNVSIFSLILSIAEVSAPVLVSILLARCDMNNNVAIHIFAQITSTAIIFVNAASETAKISFMAAWLAPPPIQLPARVVIPRQMSLAADPAKVSGEIALTAIKAIGPPIIIPKVPVKNIIPALGPRRIIPFKSTLIVNKTKAAGKR